MARAGVEARGAIFTKPEVVEFILDLAGYTADRPLHRFRLLEPSFGDGDFLLPIIERLLEAYARERAPAADVVADLQRAICAVEVHSKTVSRTKDKVRRLLVENDFSEEQAEALASSWIIEGDFLLVALSGKFTHVVGNPPYVRQELIPNALLSLYRSHYSTIYDRADLYVPFIERSLLSLGDEGVLAFICSDRWMKNRYGGPLRELVAKNFHLTHYIDMVTTQAFQSDVVAYPAITVISRERPGKTRIAHRPEVTSATLRKLAKEMCSDELPDGSGLVEVSGVANGSEPWILNSFDQLALVRKLEASFPLIEETGCRIGIGVATGADAVFVGQYDELPVEESRKLPLVMTKDIHGGVVDWRGKGVINPFNEDGSVVRLDDYPKMKVYIEKHEGAVRRRNVAKRSGAGWFRTIDKINPQLTNREKLLIPDIKGEANVVYEGGEYYPHHNLYYITSDEWDVRALQAVLLSGIARLFVATYSTRMSGGYLRFQAQYLRRIRLPYWSSVAEDVRQALIDAAIANDINACNEATFGLYRFTDEERAIVGGSA